MSNVQHATSQPDAYETADLCRLTGLSRFQIVREANKGEVPGAFMTAARRWFFPRSADIDGWIKWRRGCAGRKRYAMGRLRRVHGDPHRILRSALFTIFDSPHDAARIMGRENAATCAKLLRAGPDMADLLESAARDVWGDSPVKPTRRKRESRSPGGPATR